MLPTLDDDVVLGVQNLLELFDHTGDPYDAAIAERLRGVLNQVQTGPLLRFAGPDVGVRYVAESGDKNNDGLSWATAKASVSAAATSLSHGNVGGVSTPVGKVSIGRGIFREQGLPLNSAITYEGIGCAGWGQGTTVKLVDGATDHLFRYDSVFDWSHQVRLANLYIDGNKANQTEPWDCVRLLKGGFNNVLDNVTIRDAAGVGIYVAGRPLNLRLNEVSGIGCEQFLHIDGPARPGTLASFLWTGGQIDNCGPTPVLVDVGPGGARTNRTFQFTGVKFESDGQHKACITTRPAPSGSVSYLIESVWGQNSPSSGQIAIVHEEDGVGNPGLFTLNNVRVDDTFPAAFRSDKTGTVHSGSAQLEVF